MPVNPVESRVMPAKSATCMRTCEFNKERDRVNFVGWDRKGESDRHFSPGIVRCIGARRSGTPSTASVMKAAGARILAAVELSFEFIGLPAAIFSSMRIGIAMVVAMMHSNGYRAARSIDWHGIVAHLKRFLF